MKDEIKDKIIDAQSELIVILENFKHLSDPNRYFNRKHELLDEILVLKSQLSEAGEENSYPCKSCGKVFKESELNEYTFNGDRCSEFYCNECDAGGRQSR